MILIDREIWKPIEGFQGKYLVSDLGRIQRVYKTSKRKFMMLKPLIHPKSGYVKVCFWDNGKAVWKYAHHVVAEHFIGLKPAEKYEINHKNFNMGDNRLVNLEWVTRSENLRYTLMNGRGHSKLKKPQVLEVRRMFGNFPVKKIAEQFSVSVWVIEGVIYRKTWRHI